MRRCAAFLLALAILVAAACDGDGVEAGQEATTTVPPEASAGECSAADLAFEPEPQDLPDEVGETRSTLASLAVTCNFEGLERVAAAGDRAFTGGFGGAENRAELWQQQDLAEGDEPMRFLRLVLDRPFATITVEGETELVWPSAFAFDDWADVPPAAREALKPLYDEEDFAQFARVGRYSGYRVGIAEDGEWLFFVAGD